MKRLCIILLASSALASRAQTNLTNYLPLDTNVYWATNINWTGWSNFEIISPTNWPTNLNSYCFLGTNGTVLELTNGRYLEWRSGNYIQIIPELTREQFEILWSNYPHSRHVFESFKLEDKK